MIHRTILAGCLAATLWLSGSTVSAAASILIWPIDPIIRSDERASALWLENQGTTPVTLQIRVVGWSEDEYADRYSDDQTGVIASPPLATIAPGARQLVRITKTALAVAGRETAYRVLIDELPDFTASARSAPVPQMAAMGVNVRMRYSLPLFIYGQGLRPRRDEPKDREPLAAANLSWRIATDAGRRFLYVRNQGTGHARLTHVELKAAGILTGGTPGLFGYVLPGATMRWELPASADRDTTVASLDTDTPDFAVLPPF